MIPVFYYFSAMAAVLFGLPIFLVLLSFKLIRWWSALATGLVIGALMGIIVKSPQPIHFPEMLFLASTGAASTLGFWLIWRQGRGADDIDGRDQKRPVQS
jgi:hypothetical protein